MEAVYRRLLVENRVRVERERRRHLWLGYGKLADFLIGTIAAGVLVHTHGPFRLLLIPLAVFIVLIVVHDRVLRRLSESLRLAKDHGSTVTLDGEFGRDLEAVVESHPEPLKNPWD